MTYWGELYEAELQRREAAALAGDANSVRVLVSELRETRKELADAWAELGDMRRELAKQGRELHRPEELAE